MSPHAVPNDAASRLLYPESHHNEQQGHLNADRLRSQLIHAQDSSHDNEDLRCPELGTYHDCRRKRDEQVLAVAPEGISVDWDERNVDLA